MLNETSLLNFAAKCKGFNRFLSWFVLQQCCSTVAAHAGKLFTELGTW